MQKTVIEEQAVKIAAFNGIEVFRIKSGKFKTNSINIFFLDNLSGETASMNALLPAILKRGCKSLPTFRDIAHRLESLYGASFDCGVAKKGERHIIQFYIDFLSDTFAEKNSNQFDNALSLLLEIMTDPVLDNGKFKGDYLEQEKENLRKLIESRVNDKNQYSIDRCYEEMCSNEPFGIYELGTVKAVKAIENESLVRHFTKVLETYPAKVFFAGDMDDRMIDNAVNRLKKLKRGEIKELSALNITSGVNTKSNDASKNNQNVKNVTEHMSVNQSKLCLGFRTHTPPGGEEYTALLVCNGILGGGTHSKLFQNVREKASLAYYTYSRLEKFKGLMLASAGIEAANRDKTIDIIVRQLDDIKKGNITDYEFSATIKALETGLKSIKDSQMQMVDFYLSQNLAGTNESVDSTIENIKRIGKENIIRAAKKIKLDTIYFLSE